MSYIPFKTRYSFAQRRTEFENITKKYPDKIPVIIERASDNGKEKLDRHKFLVYREATVGQFMYIIRKRMSLTSEEAIFLLIGDTILAVSTMLGEIYKQHQDPDGFLYITYTGENAFGNSQK
jgi:GABA(A) receptor-associated protein